MMRLRLWEVGIVVVIVGHLKASGTNVKFHFVLSSELQQQIEPRAGHESIGKPLKKE